MIQFNVDEKQVSVYPSAGPDRPAVYLNAFRDEGGRVYEILKEAGCLDFTLITVSRLNWDCDMSPWYAPPIAEGDTPCPGGADDYLRLLRERIAPEAERNIAGTALWRAIAGYSLAGLFAVYALYRTDFFNRAASMSGSMWFPDFKQFVFSEKMKRNPDFLYFSLGDKESETKNPFLKTVRQNTEEIAAHCRGCGIETVFKLNAGNHYFNAEKRTADGIKWLLER